MSRDAGAWERFATVWHDDGYMMATRFQGPAREFIRVSRKGFERGVRAEVHGVLCDVVCTGRFYDFLESRAGRWGIVLRQPIYEKDRLDPVDPAARLELRTELLERFPTGYRHLGYAQAELGFEVKRDMPGLTGPAVEELYRRGADWLAGRPLKRPR